MLLKSTLYLVFALISLDCVCTHYVKMLRIYALTPMRLVIPIIENKPRKTLKNKKQDYVLHCFSYKSKKFTTFIFILLVI